MYGNYWKELRKRMQDVGMTYPALAYRTGMSEVSLKRILAGKEGNPKLKSLHSIASALGVELVIGNGVRIVATCSPEEFREDAAERRAEKLVQLVQGNSALEAQAVNTEARKDMVRRTIHELLGGSSRRLWAS